MTFPPIAGCGAGCGASCGPRHLLLVVAAIAAIGGRRAWTGSTSDVAALTSSPDEVVRTADCVTWGGPAVALRALTPAAFDLNKQRVLRYLVASVGVGDFSMISMTASAGRIIFGIAATVKF